MLEDAGGHTLGEVGAGFDPKQATVTHGKEVCHRIARALPRKHVPRC